MNKLFIEDLLIKNLNLSKYFIWKFDIATLLSFNLILIFVIFQKIKSQRTIMDQQNKFDGILMTIIQQKGNINGFFETMFGFLRRKTDFFANQKQAQQIIVNSCKDNFQKFNLQAKQKGRLQQKRKEQAQSKRKQKQTEQRKKGQKTVQKKVELKKAQPSATQKKEQDNQPAPKGNGGRTDKYIWTQTLQVIIQQQKNLQMFIFLDSDVSKKTAKVTITIDKLQIIIKGQTLISGKWKSKINAEETYWTIQDGQVEGYKGKYLHINVQKWKNQTSWWSTPVQGDTQINTQKINPEPSKLSDLEGQTRSTVEKMMFDMKQKQQGLPSSDELQKKRKMDEFMKAHPQMDFSQCKFG